MTASQRRPAGLLHHTLTATATATLALLGIGTGAQATLVTRTVGVTLDAASFASYDLDLDQDGSADFTFTAAYAPDPDFTVAFDTIDVPFASENAFVVDASVGDGFPTISRLLDGASVAGSSLFSSFGDQGNLAYLISTDPNPLSGNFSGQTGYVGLRLVNGADTFYGFAQITVAGLNADNAFDLTIGTVGFDNVAGTAVQIPGGNAVPEPGSVALLAAAGFGFLLTRRRPRAAA